VLSQTGNQRRDHLWTYYKFDALDRLVLSGQTKIPGDRRDVAKLVEEFYSSNPGGERRFEVAGDNQGYSNRSFPVLGKASAIDHVIYYDDYRFISALLDSNRFAFTEELGAATPLPKALDQITGERLRVLPSDGYISKAVYYDQDYRPIQVVSENHLGGTTRLSQTYTFTGRLLQSLYKHQHAGETTRVQQDHTYDHAERLTRVHHQVNEQTRTILYEQKFNDLGQVVQKNLHSIDDGTTFAQLLDFRYNIRGWMTSINRLPLPVSNDGQRLFALEQGYETQNASLGNVPQFNGNVSFATWMNAHFREEQSYLYQYDAFDRLESAQYRAAGPKDKAYDVTEMRYDANGNILGLTRYGFVDMTRTAIDRLTYTYRANQLVRVDDATGDSKGFHDDGVPGDAYEYDPNGNLVRDHNKRIKISYNYPNLVERIVSTTTGESVRFGFDAAGHKCFRYLLASDGSSNMRRDYASHCIFENGTLRFLMHDEGQLIRSASGKEWTYQYHLLDPQGNVRVAFQVHPAVPGGESNHKSVMVLAADYYPFGLLLVGDQHFDVSGSMEYLFGNKEFQDILNLGWYDFGARMLDPAVGRWTSMDPLAEKYPDVTPYGFVLNNPTRYADPDGRDPRDQARPRLTIVDYGSGLSDKELKFVAKEAKRALDDTTKRAQDPTLKTKGVDVTFQHWLQGVEDLRRKGYILVYLIHDIKDDRKREGIIRDVLTAEGALKGNRLDQIAKRVTSDLSETVEKGTVFGQSELDPASNVAFINIDLVSGRGIDSLRAIAGDVLHEGVGHRALPPPKGDSTYHNPQGQGVMSENVREKATPNDILFEKDEWGKVNDFLKATVDNPGWNKD
jgi:RHS repeat-associated protein